MLVCSPAASNTPRTSAFGAFAEARAAAINGALERSASAYGTALALAPGNDLLASRTFAQAIVAGDKALALKAARALEAAGPVATDVQFMLLSDAIGRRDWRAASRRLNAIETERIFQLLAPVMRAWLMFETDRRQALATLDAANDPSISSYVAEHRALMLLALGRSEEGATAITALASSGGGRGLRLRVAAAATLAGRRDRKAAAALLAGSEPPIVAARALLEARKPIPGAIDGARTGIAEFLVRIAADVASQNGQRAAITYARLASFLAPDNSETWLVISDLLANAKEPGAALLALDPIEATDPFAASAADARVRLLAAAGDRDAAIARARAQAEAGGIADWARLGDLYNEAEKLDEAADAYGRALALAKADPTGGGVEQSLWMLHMLRGGVLEQLDRWDEAKPELEEAYKLAPTQPLVLNYLGYSQLERRENLVEAERLVREASRLQPDNAAITDSLGWALFLNGRVAEAIDLLEKAASGETADPTIHEHLGDAYFSAGRRVEARYAWRAALLAAEAKDAERLRAKIDVGLTPELASP